MDPSETPSALASKRGRHRALGHTLCHAIEAVVAEPQRSSRVTVPGPTLIIALTGQFCMLGDGGVTRLDR